MTDQTAIRDIDLGHAARLDPEGHLHLSRCLQCRRCSSGCTMRLETDLLPHQINRMAALGLEEQLIASRAIWTCASCGLCVSRCPMEVNTPALIDRLRELAGSTPADPETKRIRVFNETMLRSARTFGRVYELGMMGEFKLRARDFFSDLGRLPAMLRKRKFRLLPPLVAGRKSVARILRRARQTRRAAR